MQDTEEEKEVQSKNVESRSPLRPNPPGDDHDSGGYDSGGHDSVGGVVYEDYRSISDNNKGPFDRKLFPNDGRGSTQPAMSDSLTRKKLREKLNSQSIRDRSEPDFTEKK